MTLRLGANPWLAAMQSNEMIACKPDRSAVVCIEDEPPAEVGPAMDADGACHGDEDAAGNDPQKDATREPAVQAGIERCLRAAKTLRADVAAAAGIGVLALALAIAGNGHERDVPGPAFERALLSHVPASSAAAGEAEAPALDGSLPDAVLAGRLVEDPVFERLPARRGHPPAGDGSSARATDDEQPSMARSARGEAVLAVPPLTPGRQVENGPADVMAPTRTASILAAANPVPARRAGPSRPQAHDGPPVADGIAVQLVAVARREQASDAWSRLRSENVDLLADLQPQIIDPGLEGTALYRLRAGPFISLGRAQELCAVLSVRKVDCIVVRNAG